MFDPLVSLFVRYANKGKYISGNRHINSSRHSIMKVLEL